LQWECMETISVDEVEHALRERLDQLAATRPQVG
jgi:hypothetical protein